MTDTTAAQGEAPAISQEQADLNANMESFFSFQFEPAEGTEREPDPQFKEQTLEEEQPSGSAPSQSASTPDNAETPSASTEGGGDQPAQEQPKDGGTPAESSVDPAALLAMINGSTPAPAGDQPQPKPNSAPAGEEETSDYTPFQGEIKIDPALSAALFEAEDVGTRDAALGKLIAGIANSVTAVMERRIVEHHRPKFLESFTSSQAQVQAKARVEGMLFDEVSGFPELRAHPDVVAKAFQVIAARNPELKLEDALPQVGALARKFVEQTTGIALASGRKAPAPQAQQQQQAPVKQVPPSPKKAPFLAGGSRPDGAGDLPDPNSPAGLLADMTF
jgi:hypothetical protein